MDFARSNPLEARQAPAGPGFVTNPGCIQCQQPAHPPRKRGKDMSGPLKGMAGLLCQGCRAVNDEKAAARAAA